MRPIYADVLKQHIDKLPALPDGNFAGNHSALKALINMQPTIQPVATDTNVGDKISKFIDGLEEIFADIRERHVDDSVCGLCEYDGAYIGQSGDWCNECPVFDRDDCFKLSDKARRGWAEEIIKALPTIQPEPTDEQKSCEYCHEDSDGYTRPIEKNCHAYIRFGMNGWELDLKAKGWHGEAQIKFCPMCGRKLQGGR